MTIEESGALKPIRILLVEDNPADVVLTKERLLSSKARTTIDVAIDGVEALRFLQREGAYKDSIRPDLILLDLNLPKKDGREVLSDLKSDPAFRRIPVVVMTSSNAEADVAKSYDLGANAYITKPVDLEQFTNIVKSIETFWFAIVTLPGEYSLQ